MCFKNNLIHLAPSNLIRIQLNSAEFIHHFTRCTLIHLICNFILKMQTSYLPSHYSIKRIHFMHKLTDSQGCCGKQNMCSLLCIPHTANLNFISWAMCALMREILYISLLLLIEGYSLAVCCFSFIHIGINGSIKKRRLYSHPI